jgi:chromosome segregation ATPase
MVSNFQREIHKVDQQAEEMESAQATIEARISALESTIRAEKEDAKRHKAQVAKAKKAGTSVKSVQQRADSITNSVQDLTHELQHVKQKLDSCAALLSKENAELKVESSWMDGLATKRTQRARSFKREKEAMERALEALAGAGESIPALHPGASMKFLTMSPPAPEVGRAALSSIPELSFI